MSERRMTIGCYYKIFQNLFPPTQPENINPEGTIVRCQEYAGFDRAYKVKLIDKCGKKVSKKCTGWILDLHYFVWREISIEEIRKLKLKKIEKCRWKPR